MLGNIDSTQLTLKDAPEDAKYRLSRVCAAAGGLFWIRQSQDVAGCAHGRQGGSCAMCLNRQSIEVAAATGGRPPLAGWLGRQPPSAASMHQTNSHSPFSHAAMPPPWRRRPTEGKLPSGPVLCPDVAGRAVASAASASSSRKRAAAPPRPPALAMPAEQLSGGVDSEPGVLWKARVDRQTRPMQPIGRFKVDLEVAYVMPSGPM